MNNEIYQYREYMLLFNSDEEAVKIYVAHRSSPESDINVHISVFGHNNAYRAGDFKITPQGRVETHNITMQEPQESQEPCLTSEEEKAVMNILQDSKYSTEIKHLSLEPIIQDTPVYTFANRKEK